MRLLHTPGRAAPERRGAALLMAFLVIVVIILIASQISRATSTNSRVARNEEILLAMDLAIESVLLQVHEDLKTDGEAAAAGEGGGGGADAALGAIAGGAAPGGEGGDSAPPSDSREDEWARAQRTEVGEIRLRILIQDEDSKFNLLSVLTEDEDEAEKAFDRLVRVLDKARGDTLADLDGGEARAMADIIYELLASREDSYLPEPFLLSDDEENENQCLLLSLRELVALEAFTEDHFRDYRDERGEIVHSLGSFLTVWSSLTTADQIGSRGASSGAASGGAPAGGGTPDPDADGDGGSGQGGGEGQPEVTQNDDGTSLATAAGGQGGQGGAGGGAASGIEPVDGAINLNTAPPAVLKSIFDDRDVPPRFWDDVIEYRNDEDEEIEENEDPPLDEYGEEITVKQFFDSMDELASVDGYSELDPIYQGEVQQLFTTQSNVFSIYVTARRPTGVDADVPPPATRDEMVEQEARATGLVRTVRQVVWRRDTGDGVEIIPIVRWEVLDYVPFEVIDFPDEER